MRKSIAFLIAMGLGSLAFAKYGMIPTRFVKLPSQHQAEVNLFGNVGKLLYYGGAVISNAEVVTVFWGNKVNSELTQNIGPFYKALASSNHIDWLDQYATTVTAVNNRAGTNQHIGQGNYLGEHTITPQHSGSSLSDADVQDEISLQVAKGLLPVPSVNTIYMIHFPAGITITIEGMSSCSSFCAYHNAKVNSGNIEFSYGVMPDLYSGACSFGCGSTNAFESTTQAASHEMVEAITDPIPTPGSSPAFPQAWNTSDGEEIADLCQSSPATLVSSLRTYKISGEWDNKTNTCNQDAYNSRY